MEIITAWNKFAETLGWRGLVIIMLCIGIWFVANEVQRELKKRTESK